MRGLIVDAVSYVLYVETPLTVIKNIFYNKYAIEHISTVVLSVASAGYKNLILGSSFLTGFSKTWCDRVNLYLFQLSFVRNIAPRWALLNCYVCKRCFKKAVSIKYILYPICMLITVCFCSFVYNVI
jgi:hypothetical protein